MNAQVEIRRIINDEFAKSKGQNPAFSLRAFARKIGIQPSALSEILNGKRDVTRKMASRILDRLCFDPESTGRLLDGMTNRRAPGLDEQDRRDMVQLNMDHFHVISDWYYFGILSLSETKGFQDDPEWVASRLNIAVPEAKVAMKRLERLGLLKRNSRGRLVWSGLHFKTTSDVVNMSLRKSHYQNLELAKQALDIDGLSERDFSSMTMAIDPAKVPEAKEMIKQFRRRLSRFMESGAKKEVYRICIQLFPLSRSKK